MKQLSSTGLRGRVAFTAFLVSQFLLTTPFELAGNPFILPIAASLALACVVYEASLAPLWIFLLFAPPRLNRPKPFPPIRTGAAS